jgi:hypothetical protein
MFGLLSLLLFSLSLHISYHVLNDRLLLLSTAKSLQSHGLVFNVPSLPNVFAMTP